MQYKSYPSHTHSYTGKCLSISFPHHQTNLIDRLDELAESELEPSRSHYLRSLITREYEKLQDQTKGLAAA